MATLQRVTRHLSPSDEPGLTVQVKEDGGQRTVITRTRSATWKLASGHEVVLLEGRSGGYSTSRVQVILFDADLGINRLTDSDSEGNRASGSE